MPAPDAVDYSFTRPNIQQMKAAGIKAVARYLTGSGKALSRAEADALRAAGIAVVLCHETSAGAALGGTATGQQHRAAATAAAKALGVPAGVPIHYAIDFQPLAAQMPKVLAYLAACQDPTYPARLYGSADVLDAADRPGWQTYAWSGGRVSRHATLYQYLNGQQTWGGVVDFNRRIDPARLGAWLPLGQTSPPVPKPAPAKPGPDRLITGQALARGQSITCAGKTHRLALQSDGNLVLYHGARALWATGTVGRGHRLTMQADGNLVLYDAAGKALWSSGTAGTDADRLVVQTDGNLVLYGSRAWWASGTNGDRCKLAPAPAAQAPAPTATHTVKAGDTLWVIAHDASTSVDKLIALNRPRFPRIGLPPDAHLEPGWVLRTR